MFVYIKIHVISLIFDLLILEHHQQINKD